MADQTIYDSYVITSLLANNSYGITQVHHLTSVKSLCSNQFNYQKVDELINQRNFDQIKGSGRHNEFRQYLDIMEFTDQNNRQYFVTVYDSDELWQDPEVIKIYPKQL